MNLKIMSMVTLMTSSLICQSTYAFQDESISFKNHRGSLLELNILADNKISGYFTRVVASKTCPEAIGTKQPVISI